MLIFVIVLFFVVCINIKIAPKNELFIDYCNKENSTAINGIFTVLIFLSHARLVQFRMSGMLDMSYKTFAGWLGQTVIASYLFFSAFGIMENIKRNGFSYTKKILFKRIFITWINFAVCVVIQLISQLAIGENVPVKKLLLSFTAYDSVYDRNYNWYIMFILILYLFTFVSFAIFKMNKYAGASLVTVLTVALTVVFYVIPSFSDKWSNMGFVYPLGMWYSIFKDKIDAFLFGKKRLTRYICTFSVVFAGYIVAGSFKSTNDFIHNIFGMMLALLLVLVSMKVKISNPILEFIGKNTNGIYLLQLVPFTILRHFGFSISHKYIFVVVSFVATCLMSALLNFCTNQIKNKLSRTG